MNPPTQTLSAPAFLSSAAAGSPTTDSHKVWQKVELAGLGVLLIVLNWSVLQGVCNARLIFMPEAVRQGEWWRLFTHPFIHVTWLHLLLDGVAFMLLYRDLQESPWVQRVLLCIGSAVGSLLVCFCAHPMLFPLVGYLFDVRNCDGCDWFKPLRGTRIALRTEQV